MSDQHVIIQCDCSSTLVRIERRLREISKTMNVQGDAIDNIYKVLESIDDINDVIVALNSLPAKLKDIVPEGNSEAE